MRGVRRSGYARVRAWRPRSVAWALLLLLGSGCIDTDRDKWVARGARPVEASALRGAIDGNTLDGYVDGVRSFTAHLATGGQSAVVIADRKGRGAWRVADDGELCLRYPGWHDGAERCMRLLRRAEGLRAFDAEGEETFAVSILPGNPRELSLETDLAIARRQGFRKLTAAELRKRLVGNTLLGELEMFGGQPLRVQYSRDSKLKGTIGPRSDRGVYRIEDDGDVCTRWTSWQDGRETCGPLWCQGDRYAGFTGNGQRVISATIVEGAGRAK